MNFSQGDSSHNEQDLLFLRELVELETPSFDPEASERIARIIAHRFIALGGEVRTVATEAGTNLVADFAGHGEPILFVGHTDTVWPTGTLASELPWSESDGIIRGPGVFDMKSGIVVMCAALERLQHRPRSAVRIVLNCDEEVGSPTTRDLVRDEASGCRAAIGFESPHPDGALKLGRRGSTRVVLRVRGRSAHAALDPENGVSAIDELVDQLLAVRAITSDPDLPSPVLANVGVISGGSRANVVPERASAEIGLRFVEPESENSVLSRLQALQPVREGATVEVDTLSSRPAWRASDGDRALAEAIARAGATVGQSIEGRPAAGAGDTNLIGALGIPTIDGFGPLGGGAHALDEHIVASTLRERVDLLTVVLQEL
ncbi:M20 family metallopeptidase [uncultured Agrococcus sp.]|uniref:M20 family metallopeptidase n=1 Tax=uncultured Agrococcus sp. TaxID=382258 RepID=UPI0025F48286|nr:M20 family metallopeptidase [uncultured Agrococcus sp.]